MSIEASDDTGESPAVEVLKFQEPQGHFAASTEPRSPRPPHVKYRVGQVIVHKKYGYRGVIVGWDSEAKAPEEWLRQMHPPDKKDDFLEPYYLILLDGRHFEWHFPVYAPESEIELSDKPGRHWRKLPNYSVLVDTRDRNRPQKTYVVEENIEVVSNTKILHPDIDDYFESFDGAQYIPRPAVKKLYPHD